MISKGILKISENITMIIGDIENWVWELSTKMRVLKVYTVQEKTNGVVGH